MKRLIKIISIIMLSVLSALCLFACGAPSGETEKGLIVKQIRGKDTYAVVKYVDDGRESTVLNLKEEAEKISLEKGEAVVISSILKEAFAGNDTLTEIIVPDTVEEIGEGAFSKMHVLKKLTVPFIGKNANADTFLNETKSSPDKAVDKARTFGYFFGSSSYDGATKITQQFAKEQNVETDENGNATEEAVNVFFDYYVPLSLTEVTISPKETSNGYGIPMYAFAGNNLLEKVNLNGKFRAIGDSAFKNCNHLNGITIPKDVKVIEDYAFYACTGISEIEFESGSILREIGNYAFGGIKVKELTTLPSGVEKIGDYCFASTFISGVSVDISSDLETIVLPEGLKTIGRGACVKCQRLVSATLPLSLTTIYDYAFAYCSNLETIYYSGDINKVAGENWDAEAGDYQIKNS